MYGRDSRLEIGSARQAAEVLVLHWPEGSYGSKHLAAQVACLDVMEGRSEPEHARRAFVEAARDAGILLE